MDNSSAAILIPAFRAERWIESCLDSLRQSIGTNHYIYVIDNGENNGSVPNEIGFKNYSVIQTPHSLGFAEANNFVLPRVLEFHEYICFLNQDTISTKGWLDSCLKCLEDDQKLGALMPFVTLYDGSGTDPACAQIMKDSTIGPSDSRSKCKVLLARQITAAAMVVKTSVLVKAGPFDPVFGSYCEDFDLGDRIISSGCTLGICLNSQIAHFSGSASIDKKALKQKSVQSIRNRSLLQCRRANNRWFSALKIFVVNLPRHIAGSLYPGRHAISSVIKAYAQLLQLLPRLFSAKYDRKAFLNYQKKLGWPQTK